MRADFLLDYDVVTVEQEHKLYLMARLTAGPAPSQNERRPLNLSLVIDRSGSMAGSKIDYTRQAAGLLVQNLANSDMFSVVLYNEAVETLLPPQQVEHKDLLRQRINKIRAGGTTNLSGGWLEGINHVLSHHQPEQINRVILMSDGLANRGITDPNALLDIARQKHDQGVSTTTMGLGEDFNEDLMIAIADAGGGAFYFIDSPEAAPGIFQEELRGLLKLVGQNLTISITPTSHVTEVRQMNAYPEEKVGGKKHFRMGDVYGEEVKTLMLELHIPAMKQIGEVQIATLRFEYDELTEDGSEHKSMEMAVGVNVKPQELAPGEEEENEEVTRSVLLLKAAEARRKAIELADKGNFGEAAKTLRDAAEAIRVSGLDDEILRDERGALIAQATDMDRGEPYYRSYNRKSMSTQVYFTGHGSHEDTLSLRKREQQRKKPENPDAPGKGEADEHKENRKTFFFENPLADTDDAPPAPKEHASKLPPTHVRWRNQLFALDGDLIRIGRAPQNEIVIDTSGVSRFHCQITRDGERLILEDLGSTNGTHLHGRSLDTPHALHEGDVAYLCDQRIIFERQ